MRIKNPARPSKAERSAALERSLAPLKSLNRCPFKVCQEYPCQGYPLKCWALIFRQPCCSPEPAPFPVLTLLGIVRYFFAQNRGSTIRRSPCRPPRRSPGCEPRGKQNVIQFAILFATLSVLARQPRPQTTGGTQGLPRSGKVMADYYPLISRAVGALDKKRQGGPSRAL